MDFARIKPSNLVQAAPLPAWADVWKTKKIRADKFIHTFNGISVSNCKLKIKLYMGESFFCHCMQMLSQPKWKIFQSLLSGNDSECGLDPHIFNTENLGYSFNIWNWRWMLNLSFDRANVPREMAKRIWIGMDGWLAPKSFLTILKFPKIYWGRNIWWFFGRGCLLGNQMK